MKHIILIPVFLSFLALPQCTLAKPIHLQIDYSEPWGYYSQTGDPDAPKGQLKGIWIEIIRLFTKQTGIEFNTTVAPHARVLQNLEHGKIDMSFQIRPNQDSKSILYIAEMFPVEVIAVSIKNNPVAAYEDLMGKRIGIVRGTKVAQPFDNDRQLFKQPYRNYNIILSMLFQKRLDVVVGDRVSISYLIKKNNFPDTCNSSFLLRKSSIWMQISVFSLHKHYMNRLVKANTRFTQRGEYSKVIQRYIERNM
jgi:polar amino acid transport system substrate-binding protein